VDGRRDGPTVERRSYLRRWKVEEDPVTSRILIPKWENTSGPERPVSMPFARPKAPS